jgi:tetratricopeptide (TPR) repeat protein
VDLADPAAASTVSVPDSLHSLVLSRIDAAAEGPRRTMKVASVVGRVFEAPTLPGAYEELGSLEVVVSDLEALRSLDLVSLDRAEEQAWMFKHVVTQEVAYESLPFALRADLHGRVGAYLEERGAGDLDRWVPILEHHYWRSDRQAKKLAYLRLAAARAQAQYANNAAIAYYDRLLTLVEGPERVETLLALGKVLDLIGAWDRAIEVDEAALAAAESLGDTSQAGWARTALADIARRQGRFDDATANLDIAGSLFRARGDDAGLGQVLHLSGTVAAMRGDLEQARDRYLESLAIRQRLGDRAKEGALYSNLAIVAEYEGDLGEAERLSELAYRIRTEAGDRWGIGVSLHNLGVYATRLDRPDDGRRYVEQALGIMLEVGDPVFAASERMLLGNMARDAGDLAEARALYAASIQTYVAVEDPVSQAEFLEDVALLATRMGSHERAVELVAAAATLREAIGATESEASVDAFQARLAPSLAALGASVPAAQARGAALAPQQAIERALELCREGSSG